MIFTLLQTENYSEMSAHLKGENRLTETNNVLVWRQLNRDLSLLENATAQKEETKRRVYIPPENIYMAAAPTLHNVGSVLLPDQRAHGPGRRGWRSVNDEGSAVPPFLLLLLLLPQDEVVYSFILCHTNVGVLLLAVLLTGTLVFSTACGWESISLLSFTPVHHESPLWKRKELCCIYRVKRGDDDLF